MDYYIEKGPEDACSYECEVIKSFEDLLYSMFDVYNYA